MAGRSALDGGALALTVHGPAGAVDLVVPPDARAEDVSREYAAQSGLPGVPQLRTRRGDAVAADDELSERGVQSGDVLAVEGAVEMPRHQRRMMMSAAQAAPGAVSGLWVGVACGIAVLAGWMGAHSDGIRHDLTVVLLAVGAFTGLVPTGWLAPRRAVVAPAFAGAAAFSVAWSPETERIPTVVGVAALVAAVVAAAARAMDRRAESALRVWIIAGAAVFVVTSACALLGFAPQVPWGVLFVGAVLGARIVPSYAVDVPDNFLIDLERLAVTAWSARTRPPGRRGRTMVPPGAVAEVAARGASLLTASSWAILAIATLSAPMMLATTTSPIDRIGARIVVLCGACALLLTARSYRYGGPRGLLRLAGILSGIAGLAVVLSASSDGTVLTVGIAGVVLALILVAAAVATGRGWRSVWWAARADLAEGLCGAAALGTLVVATGLFRHLWESGFGV